MKKKSDRKGSVALTLSHTLSYFDLGKRVALHHVLYTSEKFGHDLV